MAQVINQDMAAQGMSFDNSPEVAGTVGFLEAFSIARSDSMELNNDPRFFSKNVIDKRLGAFGKLSIVNGLMLGTSMKCLFALKKNMNFEKAIAWWQISGFFIQMIVAFSCLFSLYVIAHQLFYTYRLLTAGPTGFEQAAIFYLSKTITIYRHMAVKALLNGLWLFILAVGITMYVKFVGDASHGTGHQEYVVVLNLVNGTSTDGKLADVPRPGNELDMGVHTALAFTVLGCFWTFTLCLCWIRRQHVSAFQECYHHAQIAQQPLLNTHRSMATRGAAKGYNLDT